MSVIAFVPARIGSTRLPRKNLRTVGGVSLIGRAVDCALQAGGGAWRVVVSVDHPDLLAAAQERRNGVEYHHQRTASDTSQIEDAMLDWLALADVRVDDVIVMLQPTSPLRKAEHARACADAMRTGDWASALTYTSEPHVAFAGYAGMRGWEQAFETTDGTRPRTQDLPRMGFENGAAYATTVSSLRASGKRAPGPLVFAVPMDPWDAIDIDTERDLRMAEWLLEQREGVFDRASPDAWRTYAEKAGMVTP